MANAGNFHWAVSLKGEEFSASGHKEAMRPQGQRTTHLLIGLGGRNNGRTQGDNPWVLLVTSSLAHCLPSHAVLRCPTAAAFPRQAAGTHLASPPCSHPALATHAPMSAHPHTLFLQTHTHALISHSFWTTSPTTAQALE